MKWLIAVVLMVNMLAIVVQANSLPFLPFDSTEDTEQTGISAVINCARDNNCPMSVFTDADMNAWYHDGIHYCVENGLMLGTGSDRFSPDTVFSRAMIVTVLWRLEGEPAVEYEMGFTDVGADSWYTKAVCWAAASGIVNGYDASTFGPNDNLTREQIMAILHRYAKYQGTDSAADLSNDLQYQYSTWAEKDIIWADAVGLTANIGLDIHDMTAEVSRAEVTAYLLRYCEQVSS